MKLGTRADIVVDDDRDDCGVGDADEDEEEERTTKDNGSAERNLSRITSNLEKTKASSSRSVFLQQKTETRVMHFSEEISQKPQEPVSNERSVKRIFRSIQVL